MTLSKKSLSELDKLIGEMNDEQLDALFSEIGAKVLPNATMDYLIETRDSLNELINKAQEAVREEKMKELTALAEQMKAITTQFNLPLPNIPGISPPARRERLNGATSGERASPKAKFRDPVSGKTYSGRGIMAGWLAHYIEEGLKQGISKEQTLEKYRIKE